MEKRRLTQAQIADYEQLCHDRTYGRILTPNGLRFVCESCNFMIQRPLAVIFLKYTAISCPDHVHVKRPRDESK